MSTDLSSTHKEPSDGETRSFASAMSAQSVHRSFTSATHQFQLLPQIPRDGIFLAPLDDVIRRIDIHANGSFSDVMADLDALGNVDRKAATLGYGSQDRLGDVVPVDGGYFGRYLNHDIYSAIGGAAVEVHGDIRAKYNALGGAAGVLGIPVTDELVAPDGVGRYNHFKKDSSIYWTRIVLPVGLARPGAVLYI